eukprot:5650343-Prymnesium_polylepis.1
MWTCAHWAQVWALHATPPAPAWLAPPALAAVRAIEADCDSWTPPADLARGRCCRAQADGVVAAGTLGALLRRPGDLLLRAQADAAHVHDLCYDQAVLPCALGGVQLACAAAICKGAFLAGVTACIAFICGHLPQFGLLDSHLSSDTSMLPLILELHRAHAHWSSDAGDTTTSLSHLLAGLPCAQSALCGGFIGSGD